MKLNRSLVYTAAAATKLLQSCLTLCDPYGPLLLYNYAFLSIYVKVENVEVKNYIYLLENSFY